MSNKFKLLAEESLGEGLQKYYVYALVDPRNRKIFYIGKGQGSRVYNHTTEALDNENKATAKLDLIREIRKSGQDVIQYVIRTYLTEKEAFFLESALIDVLNFKDFNLNVGLLNIVSGHHDTETSLIINQFKTPILTTAELNAFYSTEPIKSFKHKVMAININKTYRSQNNKELFNIHPNIYEAVRKSWKINLQKAEQADFVLAEYKGIVRAIFKADKWYSEDGNRYMFDGHEVHDEEIDKLYLNKSIERLPGNINPIRYFGYDK